MRPDGRLLPPHPECSRLPHVDSVLSLIARNGTTAVLSSGTGDSYVHTGGLRNHRRSESDARHQSPADQSAGQKEAGLGSRAASGAEALEALVWPARRPLREAVGKPVPQLVGMDVTDTGRP